MKGAYDYRCNSFLTFFFFTPPIPKLTSQVGAELPENSIRKHATTCKSQSELSGADFNKQTQ